jgi:hypothetical protein
MGIDPDGDRWGECWHALQCRSFRLIGQGRHAPIGTADSTATGPLGQAPIGSRSPDRWVPLATPGNWSTDQLQGTRPVRLRVRPATEGTNPDHRRETPLYTLKAGLSGGLRPPSGPAMTRRSPGNRPHRAGQPAPTPRPDRHVVLARPGATLGPHTTGSSGTTGVNHGQSSSQVSRPIQGAMLVGQAPRFSLARRKPGVQIPSPPPHL